jgi:hypothetical protein
MIEGHRSFEGPLALPRMYLLLGVRALFPVTSEKYRQSAVAAVKIWNVFIQNQIIKDDE